MSYEKTLIIIKPDGLTKNLVGLIVEKIYQYGLTIIDSERTRLSNKNIAHASDSIVSAQKEIKLIEPILKRNKESNEKKLSNKIIFAPTGMSECGKSTVGKYFDSRGIPRLKIVNIFEKVRDAYQTDKDVKIFTSIEEKKDPYALWDLFIEQLLTEMNKRKVNIVSIESLYGGGLGYYLKQKLGNHFHVIFIEASEEKRVKLQMIRESIDDANRAKQLLLSRDRIKNDSGIPQLKKIADEIIDNSGSINQLYEKVDKIIHKYK